MLPFFRRCRQAAPRDIRRGVDAKSQFHPVTVQWQAPGKIGWINLTQRPPLDACADEHGIAITATGDVSFRICAPGISAGDAAQTEWKLPGLTVRVASDASDYRAVKNGPFVDVHYEGITRMTLTFECPPARQAVAGDK